MEYRKLPHGEEQIGVVGLGMGGPLYQKDKKEIEAVVEKALANGVNYFDMVAAGKAIFEPFGNVLQGRRKDAILQIHFGASYNEKGEYAWVRDLDTVKRTLDWELKTLHTDYIDMGYLHCVDECSDYEDMKKSGIVQLLEDYHRQGIVRHMGLSSHTPAVAQHIMNEIPIDMMMFSINPAYDYEQGDEFGIGTTSERAELFKRCEAEGVGISVMKPFHGGKLLDARQSPFKKALTTYQCMQYALDRPGVLTVLPGVGSLQELDDILGFVTADEKAKDYAEIGSFTADKVTGNCVYCQHCQPCPVGIEIGLVNKYYDLAQMGDKLAADHYRKLDVKADACVQCGHCNSRCPFQVNQQARMREIAAYFG